MAFVDFTEDYGYSPKVQPLPPSDFMLPGPPQYGGTPNAPIVPTQHQPVVTDMPDPPSPKWNSQFQAWEDQSGNLWDPESGLWEDQSGYLWDPESGLWYTPDGGSIYREGVGVQTVDEYNAWGQQLWQDILAHDNAIPYEEASVFSQMAKPISRAQFVDYDLNPFSGLSPEQTRAIIEHENSVPYEPEPLTDMQRVNILGQGMDTRFTYTGDKADPFARGFREVVPNPEPDPFVATRPGDSGALFHGVDKALGGLFGGIGKVLSAGSETTRDLAELGLQSTSAGAVPLSLYDVVRGRNPLTEASKRLSGGGTFENALSPQSFLSEQNKDLSERGALDRLTTEILFDPTNVVGAGFASKALKGVEGASTLAKIARGAGRANEAIDVGMGKALGAGLKYGGREAAGGLAGITANELAGGDMEWWQAGALGALGGNLTRGKGSLLNKAAETLAKAQGRGGLAPMLGGQIDDVTDPVVREIMGLPPLGEFAPTTQPSQVRGLGAERIMNPSGVSNPDLADRYFVVSDALERVDNKQERLARQIFDAEDSGLDVADLRSQQDYLDGLVDVYMQEQEVLQREIWDRESRGLWNQGEEWRGYIDRKNELSLEDFRAKRAGESGSVSAGIATRLGAGAVGGAAGAVADDEASPMERLRNIVGGALIGLAGPDAIRLGAKPALRGAELATKPFAVATDRAAKAYGDVISKLGAPEKGMFAHEDWFERAPQRQLTLKAEGPGNPTVSIENPLQLRILKDVPPQLPLTQNIKNAFWTLAARIHDPKHASNILDKQTYPIFKAMSNELKAISQAVPTIRQMVEAPQIDGLFKYEPNTNFILGADGNPLPILDEAGAPAFRDVGEGRKMPLIGVKGNDLFRNKDAYLNAGLITQAQYDGLTRLSDNLLWIRELQEAMGVLPKDVDPLGYIPSGRPSQIMEDTPVKPGGKKVLGQKPTSSYERKYKWAGDAYEKEQLVYPTIDEAVGMHIDEALKEIVVKHYSEELGNLSINGTPIREMIAPKSLDAELAAAKKEATEIRGKLKTENAKQARNDRDVRLSSKWVERNTNRAQALLLTARDQTIRASDRAEALHDAHSLAVVAIGDTVSAVKDYVKFTKALSDDLPARAALNDLIAQGDSLRKELESIGTQLENVDDVVRATSDAWSHATNIADALADDFAETARRMDALEQAGVKTDFDAARTRKALDDATEQFKDRVMTKVKQAETLAKRETDAANNRLATINTAKSEELTRVIDQRAKTLTTALDRQDRTARKIEELKEQLKANVENREAIKSYIKGTKDLASFKTAGLRGKELANRLPGWEKGVPVPAAWQNTLDELIPYVPKGSNGAGVAFDLINNIFRALGATADASWGGTVGLLGLADDPRLGAKALKEGWLAALNPEREWKTLVNIETRETAKGMPTLQRAVITGKLQIAPAEVMNLQLGKPGSWLDKLENTTPVQFFNALYRAPGDVMRVENFYKTLGEMAKRGIDVNSDEAITQAANAANVLSGRASRGFGAGIAGETGASRMFFAARFLQSQVETVLNAMLVGGVEGDVARRALLRLAGGGAALVYALNKFQGNETEWNPVSGFKFQNPLDGKAPVGGHLNSNFMRVRILGHDYSPFGPWDSLIRGIVATAQGDPYMFMRSKMAPITGMIADVTKGEDALGRPLDRASATNYLPVPFAARDVVEEGLKTDFGNPGDVADLAISGLSGAAGIKTARMTDREVFGETLEENYPSFTPKDAEGRPLNYKRPDDPLNDPLFVAQYGKDHPDELPPARSEAGKEINRIKGEYSPKFEKNDDLFKRGETTLGEWKEERSKLKNQQQGALKDIIARIDFGDPASDTPAEWVTTYYEIFEKAEKEGLIGGAFYDRVDELEAKWVAEHGQTARDYIDALTLAKLPDGPEKEYRAAIIKLNKDGYFDMPKYTGMISDLTDKEIDSLRARVSELTDAETGDPKFKAVFGKEFKVRAAWVLSDMGMSAQEIFDVSNAGLKKHQDPFYQLYKAKNAKTLAWLNPNVHYDTLD